MNENIYILMNSMIKKNCMKWNARHFMVTGIVEIVEFFTFLETVVSRFVNISLVSQLGRLNIGDKRHAIYFRQLNIFVFVYSVNEFNEARS